MKRIITLIVFLAVILPLSAEELTLTSLEEVVNLAVENNLDLKESLLLLKQAHEDLPSYLILDTSSINLSGSAELGELGDYESSLGITLPVVDQLKFTGSVNQDLEGGVGLSILPLAHSDRVLQGEIELESLKSTAEAELIAAELSAVTAVLDWISDETTLEIQEAITSLREDEYREEKIRYAEGDSTLSEIRDTLQDWSEAQVLVGENRVDAQSSALYARQVLGVSDLAVPGLTIEVLEKAITDIEAIIKPDTTSVEASDSWVQNSLSLASLQVALDDTWWFEPELKFDLSLYFDSSGMALGGGITIDIGLDDFNIDERASLKEDLALDMERVSQSNDSSMLELKQLISSLEINHIDSEVSAISLEEMELVADESEFLFSQGELSKIERDDALLSARTAENNYFNALAAEYAIWLELRYYL